MKIQLTRRNRGSAVIIVLVLLVGMFLFLGANTVTTHWLKRQVDLVDKAQVQRWHALNAATNQIPVK